MEIIRENRKTEEKETKDVREEERKRYMQKTEYKKQTYLGVKQFH